MNKPFQVDRDSAAAVTLTSVLSLWSQNNSESVQLFVSRVFIFFTYTPGPSLSGRLWRSEQESHTIMEEGCDVAPAREGTMKWHSAQYKFKFEGFFQDSSCLSFLGADSPSVSRMTQTCDKSHQPQCSQTSKFDETVWSTTWWTWGLYFEVRMHQLQSHRTRGYNTLSKATGYWQGQGFRLVLTPAVNQFPVWTLGLWFAWECTCNNPTALDRRLTGTSLFFFPGWQIPWPS